jgi:hypothetical protein
MRKGRSRPGCNDGFERHGIGTATSRFKFHGRGNFHLGKSGLDGAQSDIKKAGAQIGGRAHRRHFRLIFDHPHVLDQRKSSFGPECGAECLSETSLS